MTTLVRWDPFREVASLQNDMSRLMSTFFGAGGNGESRVWMPAVDAWETEDELVYAFDLPGVPEDKIAVEYEDGSLTVSGERDSFSGCKTGTPWAAATTPVGGLCSFCPRPAGRSGCATTATTSASGHSMSLCSVGTANSGVPK